MEVPNMSSWRSGLILILVLLALVTAVNSFGAALRKLFLRGE